MFRTTRLARLSAFAMVRSQGSIRQVLRNFDRIGANSDSVGARAAFRSVQAVRWAEMDRYGEGCQTEDEVPRLVLERARTRLAEIARRDASGDRRIGRDAVLNGPAPLFRRADRNADGILTRSQVEAEASRCHAKRRPGHITTTRRRGAAAKNERHNPTTEKQVS